MRSTNGSVISTAEISGFKSYVLTLGGGIMLSPIMQRKVFLGRT
ncbi:hypothetical protein APHMUC_0719 [Anaplasma phagocytophilum str. ApMUC09]|uniref:Uncharacterized protein n=1 Tax=Anaplasma phagocytophilum str. ApMUC09 TaxID=1359152 RepID=A0A0F3N9U2_ANAPH|nr:hypothetical protein APHMUC_0719 [Anaplasma phagocytophilum str. ApMUC09]